MYSPVMNEQVGEVPAAATVGSVTSPADADPRFEEPSVYEYPVGASWMGKKMMETFRQYKSLRRHLRRQGRMLSASWQPLLAWAICLSTLSFVSVASYYFVFHVVFATASTNPALPRSSQPMSVQLMNDYYSHYSSDIIPSEMDSSPPMLVRDIITSDQPLKDLLQEKIEENFLLRQKLEALTSLHPPTLPVSTHIYNTVSSTPPPSTIRMKNQIHPWDDIYRNDVYFNPNLKRINLQNTGAKLINLVSDAINTPQGKSADLLRAYTPSAARQMGYYRALLSSEHFHEYMKSRHAGKEELKAFHEQLSALEILGGGEVVDIHDYMNAEYFGDILVGSNQQKFAVIFDTGSANVWIPGKEGAIKCPQHKLYDHSTSSTYHSNGRQFYIQYGSGPVSGYLSEDQITVADDIKVDDYLFAEANDCSGLGMAYTMGKFDGIVGMGFPRLALDGITPLFVQMVEKKLVAEAVFSFYLSKTDKKLGEMILGGVDTSKFTGPIKYQNAVTQAYWDIPLNGISLQHDAPDFNANSYPPQKDDELIGKACLGIVDTGTSLIAGPQHQVSELCSRVGATPFFLNKDIYTVLCSEREKMPHIVFKSGDQLEFSLSPHEYTSEIGLGFCMMLVMGMPASPHSKVPSVWILGDPFMRKYFSIFDYANKKIGFALAK